MAPPNPKRPPRPPRPPGSQAPKEPEVELPFDDDEVAPLQADDPRPQRVPQYPAGPRKAPRQGSGKGRDKADRELSPKFDWGREYSNPGHPPAFLYVERGPGIGQLVPVQQGSLVLGRSSSSDLRLQHPSISRRHAQIIRTGDQFLLKDLGSQNGTFLNRVRVTGEVEVMSGDEITLGNALLRLRGPGGTPAAGLPAISQAMPPPVPHKRGLGPLGVGLVAAGVGSTVAALVTVLAVGLSSNRAVNPTEGATTNTGAATARGDTNTEPPLLVDPGNARAVTGRAPQEGAGGENAGTAKVERAASDEGSSAPRTGKVTSAPAGLSARDIARNGSRTGQQQDTGSGGSRTGEASDGQSASNTVAATGMSARDIASGASRGSPSGSTVASPTPSARDIASGASRGSSSGNTVASPTPSARDIASGAVRPSSPNADVEVTAFPEATASASDTKAPPAKPTGPVTETDVLRLYEANDLTGAMDLAKGGRLTTLHAQLVRFEAANAESRKALAKGDTARAISQLALAAQLDQELSKGWSRQGPQLRKQLSILYVRSGVDHVKAHDPSAARAAFQQALKYDSGNRSAIEGLRRLETTAESVP
ncbi:FHA domain-containing protein [Myxococcus sp. K38C18041901]|uniref:FHA domain-containing protein n=1 Tax=Myxococcus guangdongensis TaxID=2906760 RepID=UPI0020A70B0B|nr:FHA domain-containing protein [Myxococcus guangdongensis]MCP3060729.1 FHA domain-containing protein [Myxococcus guangdongensis]